MLGHFPVVPGKETQDINLNMDMEIGHVQEYIHGTWTCGFGYGHGNSKSDTDRGSWAQTLTWKIGHKLGKWKPPVLIFSEKREKKLFRT